MIPFEEEKLRCKGNFQYFLKTYMNLELNKDQEEMYENIGNALHQSNYDRRTGVTTFIKAYMAYLALFGNLKNRKIAYLSDFNVEQFAKHLFNDISDINERFNKNCGKYLMDTWELDPELITLSTRKNNLMYNDYYIVKIFTAYSTDHIGKGGKYDFTFCDNVMDFKRMDYWKTVSTKWVEFNNG